MTWYSIKSCCWAVIDNFIFRYVLPAILTASLVIYEFLLERILEFLGKSPDEIFSIENVFLSIWFVGAFVVFLTNCVFAAVAERRQNRNMQPNRLYDSFVNAVGTIVAVKLRRIRDSIRNGEDPNNPSEQLNVIMRQITDFVSNEFNTNRDLIDVSVLEKSNKGHLWKIVAFSNDCHHSLETIDFGSSESAASYCLETNESIFWANKKKTGNKYILRRRDKRHGNGKGSAFFYPIRVALPGKKKNKELVVNIVTNGRQLCDENDILALEVIKRFLIEFSRRIELEINHKENTLPTS